MIHASTCRVERPTRLDEALAALARAPGAVLLAGGTDLMVAWNAGDRPLPERVIDLWGVPELATIRVARDALHVGALATYSRIIESPEVRSHAPALVEASRTIGATQIQNRGTIGGNIANASPAGDTLPVLLAMDATIVVASQARGERAVPSDSFWLSYRRTALAPDEAIVRIEIGLGRPRVVFRKVGTRRAQAISKVAMALSLGRSRDGTVEGPRIAWGSVAPTPVRASRTENALKGRSLDAAAIGAACAELPADISPIDDIRSTREYRLHVAVAILRRALHDWAAQ